MNTNTYPEKVGGGGGVWNVTDITTYLQAIRHHQGIDAAADINNNNNNKQSVLSASIDR